MKLRPYQVRLVEDWQAVMRRRRAKDRWYRHVYLQAPTGTGKTEIVLAIANQCLSSKRVLFVTPRYTLSEQNEERAEQRLGEHDILCMTVQKLDSIARKGKTHPEWSNVEGADHIFFDEVHLYSTGSAIKGIPRIMQRLGAKGATYLSATAWGINEKVLGSRKGRMILYRFEDAYRDGVLNPVEIVRYDTGTDLEIAHKLQSENVIELLDMSPEPQARELERLGVRASDLNKMIEHRIRCLIDLHMSENLGEPALFFVSKIKYIKFARDYLSRHLARAGMDSAIVGSVNHKDSEANRTAKVRDFKDGRIKIMIAVAMLREGFDYPGLSSVYDCAYNPQNVRLALQKMGRLTRRAAKKPVSRFYYAVDSRLILSFGRKQFLRDEGGSSARADAIMMTAFADSDGNMPGEGVRHRVREVNPSVFDADGSEKRPRLEKVRLWDVRRVAGSSRAERVRIGEIMRGAYDVERKKAELLVIPRGSPKPRRPIQLNAALRHYTTISCDSYDPIFDKEIRARQPEWFVKISFLKKAKLLVLPKNSPKPHCSTSLGKALAHYANPNNPCYDPIFDKEIRARQPEWFVKTSFLKKVELLALPKNSPKPHRSTSLGRAYETYTSLKSYPSTYDPIFDKKIRARQPKWFVKTSFLKKVNFLALPKNSPVPRNSTLLGGALARYTNPNDSCYDPIFDKKIRAEQPHWFERKTA